MFVRSFRQLFSRKNQPIVNAKKAPKARKRPQLALEQLEDRVTPTTITQWAFASGTSINNAQNGTTENTVAQVTPTTGSGSLYTLGMYNTFNGGNSALDDSTSTAGTADPGFSEFLLRVRGAQTPTGHNGWATAAAGAAEYTQGIEADASTAGFTNVSFSFDWYSTTQGIRDLQVQYNTNVNNPSGWTNFVEPGGTGSNGISTSGTFLATSNDYWNATGTNGADTITVTFGSYANNDPNFGVRLVSAFDSTGHVPNDYASAQLSGGQTVIYNNNSGNWRFDNLTFSAGSTASDSSALTASVPSPQNPGTSITLTDTITPTGGGANPTGTVAFFDGATQIGTTQNVTAGSGSTGVASITINTSGSPLSLGLHNFTAQYTSTNSLPNSTTPNVAYTIGDPTSSVVTASPASPQQVGTNVTFTDTITPANIGGTSSPDGNPTGTVTFYNNGTAISSALAVQAGAGSTGTVSFSTSSLPSGADNITAVYTPSGNFLGGASPALGYAMYSGSPGPFTPGNLVILQAGDGVNQYSSQAPLYLNEVNPSTGANVQQDAIPDVGALAVTGVSVNGTTVTITTANAAGYTTGNGLTTGETVAISGITPSAFDGSYVITATGANTFTYTVTSAPGNPTSLTGATATPGQVGNQPITLDLSAAAGNGQLNRTADGSGLTFDGVDSTINNGGLTGSATPTGQDNRDVAVVSGDPTVTSNINTTVYGPFYVGDDNRGSVAVSPSGPIYTAGHPNQAGGAVSQGVHEFDSSNGASTGAQIGTQVSASTNIRGVTIGFDNRMYFSTASGLGGATALNAAGIFTEPQALPTSSTPTPANDIMVVPAIFGASKLGGVWLADMNGDGILDNGDRLYFLDDGTVGGTGTGGLYVSTWNTANTNNPWNTPNNAAAAAAGYVDYWSAPVRLGDAPTQVGSGNVGQLRGLTGTVIDAGVTAASESGTTVTITLSGNNQFQVGQNVQISNVGAGYDGSWTITNINGNTFTYTANASGLSTVNPTSGLASQAVLYTTAFDDAANDSSVVQQWIDTNTGASIASASESGTTVTITTATPNTFQTGQVVEVDGVGANSGAAAISTGYNGAWTITVIDSTHFTYTDTNSGASNLQTVTNQGAADVAIQTDASQAGQYSDLGIGNGANGNLTTNTLGGTIIQTLAGGTDTVGGKNFADVGLRGVAFAPVAATGVSLSQSPANPLSPGTSVTLTATLTNSQVTPSGLVTFIDQNTNTILGQAPIVTSGGMNTATLTLPTGVVGNHYVVAYFSGGGTLALAPADSNTIQVIEAGSTTSTTSLAASPTAAATGKQVTLTATVTSGATGTVSFFNGSVSLANLLGTSTLSGNTATLTTAFGTAAAQNIIAVYNGDNTYASSQGTTTVNVAANATATITTSANNVALNATPTYTATIVGNGTLGVPSGTVTFTIVSATTNGSGAPLVSQTSSPITLTSGTGNTATATWTSPALSAPGSYFVTISYSATGANNPYSNFAVTTTNASNGVALIETVQQAFTPGDLVAVQRGDGTVNLGSSAYPVELVEYKPSGGAEVQAIVMPDNSATGALFLSGQNGSEGLLNRSANGAYLTLAGYDLPAGHTFITSTFPYQFARTVAEVNAAGGVNVSTQISTVQVGITAVSETGTTVTATATTVSGLSVGESVVITGVSPSGYDGQFTITGINTANNTFTYTAAANLGSGTPSSAFATSSSVPYNPLDVVSYDGQEFWLVSNLPVGDTTDNGLLYTTLGSTSATQLGATNNGYAADTISGGQLYVTTGKGLASVGTNLPTTPGQSTTQLPNLSNAYQQFFPNSENPEQVLLLNTNDGTTNNPNVAYIADQANGLLKFYLNGAGISSLSETGTTVTVTLSSAPSGFATGDQVQISGASVAGYNGTFTITKVDGTHFTYTATTSGLAAASSGTASEWLYGQNGSGVFGQKLVFAGGATGLTGYVVNPGPSAQVQLYVTGSNVQQQNPNQIDKLLDTNAPSQGFPSGNFSVLDFVGGASGSGSPNGNENFAGLAFVPGAVTTTTVTSSGPVLFGNNVTFSATVTSPVDTPAGTVTFTFTSGTGQTTVLGTTALNGSGVAAFTTTSPLPVGGTVTATYNPGGSSLAVDDVSSGKVTPNIDYTPGDVIVSTVQTGAVVGGTISSISEGANNLVTVTTSSPHFLKSGSVVITGVPVAGYNNTYDNTYSVTVTGANTFTFTLPNFTGLASSSGGTVTLVYSGTAGATTLADYSSSGTHNAASDVALSTAASTATITNITVASGTATVTASNSFAAGQSVVISGVTASATPSPFNGTFTILSAISTSFTYALSTSATFTSGGTASVGGFTENGSIGTSTSHVEGLITDSTDGHSASIAGYQQAVGGNTSSVEDRVVGVLSPDGAVDTGTTLPSNVGAVRATVAPDGLGMYVATNSGLSYVPFDSTADVRSITAASWASGVATITAPNNDFKAGQVISVVGVSPSGYNGNFTILSATGGANGNFTYALTANPGSTTNVLGALAQLVPAIVSNEADNSGNSGQTPNAAYIGSYDPSVLSAQPGYLYATAGNQFQPNGIASIDGPVVIGSNLPESAGQSIQILGSGAGTNFPSSADAFGNFPTSSQIVVSPDGNTIFVADDRSDSQGGILVYEQITANNWRRIAHLQLDSFGITGASESGSVVTVTTSSAVDFTVGEVVAINGLANGSYNTSSALVTSVAGNGLSFTYLASSSNLPATGPGAAGAFADGKDGGFNSLTGSIDSNGSGTLYATTSDTSGNRLYQITAVGSSGSVSLTPTLLATAAPNTAFRGVALAPTIPGTTASTTSISGGGTSDYATGVTLTATVTSGATGWVSFRIGSAGGQEVGAAPVVNGTATFHTGGDLPPGTYTIVAVYTGDSTYAASTSASPVSVTVNQTATTTNVTLTPQNAGTGQTVTITAQVVVPAGTAPTGTVTITDGNGHTFTVAVVQTIVNPGSGPAVEFIATATTSYASLGNYTVSATYSGDTNFSGSSGSATENVVNSTVTTVTSSAANPTASPSTNVTLTAAVTSPSSSTAATGTVQFYDDTLPLGSPATLNGSGVATLTVPTTLFQSLSLLSESESGNTVTITVNANSAFTSGEMVTIAEVAEGSNGTLNGNYSGGYNGTFAVTPVSGHPNEYTYSDPTSGLPTGNTGGEAIAINTLSPGLHSITAIYTPTGTTYAGSVGVHEQAVQAQAFGATDTFTERLGDGLTPLNSRTPNNLLGSVGATNFVDEFNSSGLLVQSLTLPVADSQIFTATTASESGSTVTLTLNSPTDYAVGQLVTVAGVSVAGYNGTFMITVVSNPVGGPYTIQYTDTTTGLGAGTGGTAQSVVHGVVGHGQQSTTGQITLSADGSSLWLNGYDQNPNPALPGYASLPSVSASSVPRSIARIGADGTVTTEAFSTSVQTGGIIDSIFSPDGNQFYFSGAGGGNIYYFSSLTQSATLQGSSSNIIATAGFTVTGLEGYNGQLYFIGGGSSGGTSLHIGTVGTGYPTTTATLTQLPGIPTNTTSEPNEVFFPVDAYFTHLNGSGTAPDTLYISDDGANFGQGAITKWSLVSGSWVENGSIPYTLTSQQLGFYYLAGTTSGSSVTLFSNYGNGGNADFGPGDVYEMTDTSGYNAAPNVTTITTVDAVGSHPVFGPYAGNETNRGVALAPKSLNVGTTTTLTDNGLSVDSATAGGSVEQGYQVSFTVTVSPASGTTAPTGSVQLEDAANGNALVGSAQPLTNGTATFSVADTAANNFGAGTHQLIAVYTPTGNFSTSTSSQVAQVVDSVFKIQTIGTSTSSNFTATATGFTVTFNAPVNTSLLSDYTNGSATPSVILSNGSTPVPGSVVFDAAGTQLTFVATNVPSGSTLQSGVLAPGATYTPLLSGVTTNSQSFQDANGNALAGNGTSAGTNYATSFSSPTSATATTVWVPYVARGFSQPVNVPASSSNGLPIYVTIPSGGQALTSATFTFSYNPALLNVTAAQLDPSIASKFTGSFNINQAAGTVAVTLTANSGQSLAAGATYTVVDLTATVQTTATYKDKEVLNFSNININGGTNNGQDGSQVHVAAFLDNANGVTSSSSTPTVIPAAYSGQDAFDMLSVAGSSSSTILHSVYKLLDPTVLGDDANSGHATGQAAFDTLKVAGGSSVANIATLPNVITAAAESGSTVTITTVGALPLTVGEKVTVAGVSVAGYNGTSLTVLSVAGNQFTYTDSNTGLANSSGGDVSIPNAVGGPDPVIYLTPTLSTTAGNSVTLTVYLKVTDTNGLNYNSDDVAIKFDPTRFSASNLAAPTSGDPDFTGGSALSLSGNVDNTNGTITFSEFTNNINGVQLANGAVDAIATITFAVKSGAANGVASIHLAQQIGTHTTDVNGGTATLSPAPNDSAPALSGDPSGIPYQASTDDKFSIVSPSASITIPNAAGSTGQAVIVPINLTAGPGGFTYNSDDVAIHFNPAEFMASNLTTPTSGDPDFTGGNALSLSGNIDNTHGVITFSEFTNNTNGVQLASGAVDVIATITFTPVGSASQGATALHVAAQLGTHTTDVNGGNIQLSPAPDDSTTDNPSLSNDQGTGIAYDPNTDGKFTITVHPNQPPFDGLPSAAAIAAALGGTGVLFNPASKAGLQTATPNTVVFSSANGDAITVSDSDYSSSGPNETTTVSVIGTPAGTSTGLIGTLSATASGSATVSGNGTATLTITGSPTDISNTLNGLIYAPGAGFFGTTTLQVSTNDNGNSGFGGPLTDTRSTSLTVVGLFISEIDLLKGNATNPSQYVEVFSTVPSYTIPSGVYLVGINGAAGTPAPGLVTDIFNLGNFTTGTDGYLALLEKGEKYSSGGFEVGGGNELDNSGTAVGFGNGGTTSKFGTITAVHTGANHPSGQLVTDIASGAESFLLIQTPTAPTTATNIDPANTGNPTNQTSAYNGWNVLDSVGILNTTSTSHSYAAITFKPTGGGSTLSGSNVVGTGSWTANYVGRIAQNEGQSSADWLASVVTGTPSSGAFNLGSVNSTQFAGEPLNSIGGPNDWAPQMTVAVNDGSSTQHSQVAELTLTFSSPVNIVDLTSDFQLKDASGNALSITVTDPGTGATTAGATGPVPDSGATLLVISFNSGSADTFNFGTTTFTDAFGNTPTVGLVDGNYFLDTTVADISSAANGAVVLDGAHNGVSGSTSPGSSTAEIDEFWRLFGDVQGNRSVNGQDAYAFSKADGTTTTATALSITAASESGTTVTLTLSGTNPFTMGERVVVSGISVAGYNGTFVITKVSGNQIQYTAAAGLGTTSTTGATASTDTTDYVWYLDYNEDGNIDFGNTADSTAFYNNYFARNGGHNHLNP